MRRFVPVKNFCNLVFKITFPLSIIVYVLRGLGYLTYMPGGVLLALIFTSVFSLLIYLWLSTYL